MPDGIWLLASYPKSGNTWLRAVMATLVSGRSADINALGFLGPIACSRAGFEEALGIDSAPLTFDQETSLRPHAYRIWAAEAPAPLHCKVHDAYHPTPAGEPLFPADAVCGAVYVVRDPREVAISLAHHRAFPIDQAITFMADRQACFSGSTRHFSVHLRQSLLDWSGHVDSWLSAAAFPVHLLRYEDMHADPASAFAGVARFLGLDVDEATIAAAVAAASFARLRDQERQAGFLERPREASTFFRTGETDSWRRTLTSEQAARIVDAHSAVMQRLGYSIAL